MLHGVLGLMAMQALLLAIGRAMIIRKGPATVGLGVAGPGASWLAWFTCWLVLGLRCVVLGLQKWAEVGP